MLMLNLMGMYLIEMNSVVLFHWALYFYTFILGFITKEASLRLGYGTLTLTQLSKSEYMGQDVHIICL